MAHSFKFQPLRQIAPKKKKPLRQIIACTYFLTRTYVQLMSRLGTTRLQYEKKEFENLNGMWKIRNNTFLEKQV